jgi:hypothetical protein
MVNWNSNSVKVRQGLFKCPNCGTFYNPTNGGCPGCSSKSKRSPNASTHLIFAAIIIAFLFIMPVDAGAQVAPEPTPSEPTPVCFWIEEGLVCLNHVAMTPAPFVPTATPTATPQLGPPPLPTVTPTPTIVIQPFPTATPSSYNVYFALMYR